MFASICVKPEGYVFLLVADKQNRPMEHTLILGGHFLQIGMRIGYLLREITILAMGFVNAILSTFSRTLLIRL